MADPPQEQAARKDNERPRPPLWDIRMIVGGTATFDSSRKVCKTYLRMVQTIQLSGFVLKMARVNNPMIGVSEKNARRLHHPHDDALVVSIRVRDYNTHQVLVDNEALLISSTTRHSSRWGSRERTTSTNQCTTRWVWRNKSIPPQCGHIAHNDWWLP